MNMNIVDTLLGMTLFGAEWVLWLLLVLSVISVTIIIERCIHFYIRRLRFSNFLTELTQTLSSKDLSAVEKLCKDYPNAPLAQMVLVGLQNQSKDTMLSSMNSYLIAQKQLNEKGMTFLGTLGNNAPFIGLLGTVIGIIQAFHDLSLNPDGGPQIVMAGISEALVATAVGLFVAMPAVIAFNILTRKNKIMLQNAETVQKLLTSHLSR